MIRVMINGEAQSIDPSLSVAALLAERGLAGKRVAVEINGAIVPRSQHASTALQEADRLEIVVAVGGG